MEFVKVGDVVQVENDRGTVRFVGCLENQEGVWIGLEWDNPSRGKHDGSLEGNKYFECTSGGLSGSFIKIDKVDVGVSLPEALLLRYMNQTGEYGLDVTEDELYVHTAGRRKVKIQLVGEDKIKRYQSQTMLLKSVRLAGASVSYVGDASALSSALVNLKELDLTGNLISQWQFVEELVAALPNLSILNLSDNILALRAVHEPAAAVLTSLKGLILNKCRITWEQICATATSLPCLEELHVCANQISSLAPCSNAGGMAESAMQLARIFPKLKMLDLESNLITDWSEVELLSQLPSLSALQLSGNSFDRLHYPDSLAPPSPSFPCLSMLLLGECQIASWSDVDELDKFPGPLKDLRLTKNPLLTNSKRSGRFEIIGRVAGLTMVNGAEVKPRERKDAEIRYLQSISTELSMPGADAEKIFSRHPRLKALAAVYGEVGLTASSSATGGAPMTLGASMLDVTLTCVAGDKGAKVGSHTKKLPGSMTLGALRALCEKLFKVRSASQSLFLRLPGSPLPEPILDDDSSPLSGLGISAGSEVVIDQKEA